jgi:pimeloyl-ACP methyl ester carboxylesterase
VTASSGFAAQSILDLPPPKPGLRLAYGPGEFQFGELRTPASAGPHPVAIPIHGGYPGGGWPGTLDDVRAGALHLQRIAAERGLDMKRVAVTGHSAGGKLALWLAKQRAIELRGVVPLTAVSDLRRAWELKLSDTAAGAFLGGSPQEFPEPHRDKQENLHFFGEAPERRPWAIKRAPGCFCRAF